MTIILTKNTDTSYVPERKICDDCGRIANKLDKDDIEWLGFDRLQFCKEHYELFDFDMSYELDLCRHCMTKIFKPLLKKKYKKVLIAAERRRKCNCKNPILLGHEDVPSIPNGLGRCQICRTFINIKMF